MSEGEYNFIKMGLSGNLLRAGEPLVKEWIPPVTTHQSNLYRGYMIYDSTLAEVKEENQLVSDKPSASKTLRAFSDLELKEGMERLYTFLMDETKSVASEENAAIFFTIIERQAQANSSFLGFFEMLREADPNRSRNYRMRLVKELKTHFPDKSVAKIVTQALSKEWKDAEDRERKEARRFESNINERLLELTKFDSRYHRWITLFRNLKRKNTSTGAGNLANIYKVKEGFYPRAFLYLLHQSEISQKEFRQQIGNVYSQFMHSMSLLMSAFKGDKMEDRKTVYNFLTTVFKALTCQEILEQFSTILKLEGASAQSMCPDKEKFITGQMQKTFLEIKLEDNSEVGDFFQFIGEPFPADVITSCTYNRKDIKVKLRHRIGTQDGNLQFLGNVDALDNLEVKFIPDEEE